MANLQAHPGEMMKKGGESRGIRAAVVAALLPLLAGCGLPSLSLPTAPSGALPAMRWDHHPEAADWTRAALLAVTEKDTVLAGRVPADIAAWCPGYETASLPDRRAFWVGLLSALAKHESTWNPAASGGGGRWIGLMQISPQTARGHGCAAQSVGALKDGAANLTCAVEIFAQDVARDGVVAGKGNRGIGRDWAPFRKASKRAEMAEWTSRQPFCAR